MQVEKRNLHAYLKVYERLVAISHSTMSSLHFLTISHSFLLFLPLSSLLHSDFSRMHGRPVTKHADIQPVAHEYQRYKELKNLIRDKKLGAGAK